MDRVVVRLIPVKGYEARIAEGDHQLPQFRQIDKRPVSGRVSAGPASRGAVSQSNPRE